MLLSAPPSPAVRARLLAALEGPARHAPFAAPVARLFGTTRAAADEALSGLVQPSAFRTLPFTGISSARPPRGSVGTHAMFLRFEAGARTPVHRHLGREWVLVLEGRLFDVRVGGRLHGPGDLVEQADGSTHAIHVPPEGPCLCAYLVERGVAFVGAPDA